MEPFETTRRPRWPTLDEFLRNKRKLTLCGLACLTLTLLFYSNRSSTESIRDQILSSSAADVPVKVVKPAIEPTPGLEPPLFALTEDKINSLKRYQAHNYPNKHGYTFATLLCTRSEAVDDIYLLATRALVYRFLWHPATRSPDKPVTVFVAPFVAQWQRDMLTAEGARVIELPLLEIKPKKTNLNSERWRDQFIKLNMWNQTQFSKIAYFDADAFPIRPVDDLFQIVDTWHCKEELLDKEDRADMKAICDYALAGVPIFPFPAVGPNGGMLVFNPNAAMYQRLLRLAPQTDSYDSNLMEQGMLEWAYNYTGPFPVQQLDRKWNGVFPRPEEADQLNVVHQKLWNKEYAKEGLGWMTDLWDENWEAMTQFYHSPEFERARKKDGLRLMDDVL